MPWLFALVAGLLAAAVQYGRAALGPRVAPLALLRALAVTLVAALLLGATVGRGVVPQADIALDASESFGRGVRGEGCWRSARDSAARLGGARLLFGETVRPDAAGPPTDRASALRPVADRAAGTGTPVVVITDGELDDGELLATLPRGSRAIVIACATGPDVAVAGLEAPAALLAGDTLAVRVRLVGGGSGGPAGRLELRLDGALMGGANLPAMGPYDEQGIDLRVVPGGAPRHAVLQAVFRASGDAEPRNDSLAIGVEVTRSPAAVFVSTSPDYDAREAIAALRGVTSLPTRAYYRVAPGAWRADGTLARVTEAEVRAAVQGAPLVVIHGDTAALGAPRALTRASLLLFAPPVPRDGDGDGDWFARAAPASPLAPALGTLPYDSLSPIDVVPGLADLRAPWQGLVAQRAGGAGERRVALVGWDEPRRVAVLGAGGLWRWRFHGGVRADAYNALFGALYDWLAAGRSDRRAALPDAVVQRAGRPVRWRRGAAADSVVTATLRRRGATAPVHTVTLHFNAGAASAESPPIAPGLYDVEVAGGSALLAVNASPELVPRRPTVTAGPLGGAPATGEPPPLRSLPWPYALAIAALCVEWLGRRRVGMR